MPMVSANNRSASKFWLVLTFIEGFAAYGACLYPIATFPADDIWSLAHDHGSRSASRGVTAAERGHGDDLPPEQSNVVELGAVASSHGVRSGRWNWLSSLCETILTLQGYRRRERKIKRAAVALARLDDQTLRGMGIPDRSRIEQTVRFCHDC
jgi:hypothetical protein